MDSEYFLTVDAMNSQSRIHRAAPLC